MFASVLDWMLERIGLVAVVVIFVFQVLRGLWKTVRSQPPPPSAKPDELEAERVQRELREDIERRKAARRAAVSGEPPPLETREAPSRPVPQPHPETTQMPEPLGAPLRRILEELQREARPVPPPLPPPVPMASERRAAELERQEQLAEQLRQAEETRVLAQRRATHRAEARATEGRSESALREVARTKLLDDLRDPQSLRRAFVLREVLGPPVGLR
jgi:hypothetical protein